MPNYEFALPKGAIPRLNCEETFVRSGKDGDVPIFALLGRTEYEGDVLEGHWKKGTDGVMLYFQAKLDADTLFLRGRAAVAGNSDFGWIESTSKVLLLHGTVIDVHLNLIDHTVANEKIIDFYLTANNGGDGIPDNDRDQLKLRLRTTSTTYYYRILKKINNSWSDVKASTSMTLAEAVFRIKIKDDGWTFYFSEGSDDINEGTDEVVAKSDLGLGFTECRAGYHLISSETTERTVRSNFLNFTYPRFEKRFDFALSDLDLGICKVWDDMGYWGTPANWVRVFDPDHKWSSGYKIIENGLIRFVIQNLDNSTIWVYYYDTVAGSWKRLLSNIYPRLVDDNIHLGRPMLDGFLELSKDRVIVKIRNEYVGTRAEELYRVTGLYTLERGKRYIEIQYVDVYPKQKILPKRYDSVQRRWGYCGDPEIHGIGDDDLNLTANNTTLTDNFLLAWDDWLASIPAIAFAAIMKKPAWGNKKFTNYDGGSMDVGESLNPDNKVRHIYGIIPFPTMADLFQEAEGMSLSGGADTVDLGAEDSGSSVRFDAQTEQAARYYGPPHTFPKGRYKITIRAKDTDTVTDDLLASFENITDGYTHLQQDNADMTFTLTTSWAFYEMIIDIDDDDDGDQIYLRLQKATATANTIYVDYYNIWPITNGEDWPQDHAHNFLRGKSRKFKVSRKRGLIYA